MLDEDISAWTKFPRFGPIYLAAFLGILAPQTEIPGILVPRIKIPDGPKSLQEIPRQCSQEVWNSALLCLALLDYVSLLMVDHPAYIFTVIEVKTNTQWILHCLLLLSRLVLYWFLPRCHIRRTDKRLDVPLERYMAQVNNYLYCQCATGLYYSYSISERLRSLVVLST